ncbi:MAG TPA: helix-turn-helix transcriptional regulator [Propionicimonas sp.]|jgi:DNA-binding CsgD family transcriptional regulator
MGRALAAERVRRDVEVLARAGLDLPTFVDEAMSSLQRAVPFDSVCVGTMDPTTGLLTGTLKLGNLKGADEHDHEWGLIEYGTSEPTSFAQLAARGVTAAGVRAGTVGDPDESVRIEEFMRPHFGFGDELRALCLDERGRAWAGIALFRPEAEPVFDPDEVAYLGSLSGSLALGVRSGLLASLAAVGASPLQGPIVLIVDSTNQVMRASLGAEDRLAELTSGTVASGADGLIGSLVGAARRYARGETTIAPRSRIRAANGMWLVLHASPLSGDTGPVGEVAVTIEEARPPEIVPLVVAAFGLTPRERDITQLVLQGLDTRDIAAQLFLSAYTVQDHLKSIFEKAGVRSRRELIARVYFDQYVPRMNASLGPSGWFLEAAHAG